MLSINFSHKVTSQIELRSQFSLQAIATGRAVSQYSRSLSLLRITITGLLQVANHAGGRSPGCQAGLAIGIASSCWAPAFHHQRTCQQSIVAGRTVSSTWSSAHQVLTSPPGTNQVVEVGSCRRFRITQINNERHAKPARSCANLIRRRLLDEQAPSHTCEPIAKSSSVGAVIRQATQHDSLRFQHGSCDLHSRIVVIPDRNHFLTLRAVAQLSVTVAGHTKMAVGRPIAGFHDQSARRSQSLELISR